MSNLREDLNTLLTCAPESVAATVETARETNTETIEAQRREIIRLRSDKFLLGQLASAEREWLLAIASWVWMDADELIAFVDGDDRRIDSLLESWADLSAWIEHVADGGALRLLCLFCRDVHCGQEGNPQCAKASDSDPVEVLKHRTPKRVTAAREKMAAIRKLAEGMEP